MSEMEYEKRSFIGQVVSCLIAPGRTFRSILERPSLLRATMIILVIAIVAAWASYNYAGKLFIFSKFEQALRAPRTPRAPPTIGVPTGQAFTILSATVEFVGVFMAWVIGAALLHAFSKALRGDGSYKNILTLVGYASVPLLIQHSLRLIDSVIASPEALLIIVREMRLPGYSPLSMIVNAALDAFTIFRLWVMILFAFAVRENYKLSMGKSVAVAVATYIGMIFLSAFLPLQ